MVEVHFTENLQRHVRCPSAKVSGATVRQVLDAVFAQYEAARPYILDDRGHLRKHMGVFVDGQPVVDRTALSDPVPDGAEVYVLQALSGG